MHLRRARRAQVLQPCVFYVFLGLFGLWGYRLDDFLSNQVLGDLGAAVALVGDLLARGLRRLRNRRGDLGAGVRDAYLVSLDTDLGQRQRRNFLLLGGHDALEGREARLVDLLGDADHGGQRRLDGEQSVVGLTLAGDLAALDRDLAQVGQLGQAQVFGDYRRNRAADAVGGLVAGDDKLGALDGAQGTGQRPPRLDQVGAVQAVIE